MLSSYAPEESKIAAQLYTRLWLLLCFFCSLKYVEATPSVDFSHRFDPKFTKYQTSSSLPIDFSIPT